MSSVPTTRPEIQTSPIPQEILEEIETFEDEVTRLQNGETPADMFKPFRLQFGIYGQRQPDVQMVRIKIPFGGLTANQLRRIAELADTYATGVGHVTHATRHSIALCPFATSRGDHAKNLPRSVSRPERPVPIPFETSQPVRWPAFVPEKCSMSRRTPIRSRNISCGTRSRKVFHVNLRLRSRDANQTVP